MYGFSIYSLFYSRKPRFKGDSISVAGSKNSPLGIGAVHRNFGFFEALYNSIIRVAVVISSAAGMAFIRLFSSLPSPSGPMFLLYREI